MIVRQCFWRLRSILYCKINWRYIRASKYISSKAWINKTLLLEFTVRYYVFFFVKKICIFVIYLLICLFIFVLLTFLWSIIIRIYCQSFESIVSFKYLIAWLSVLLIFFHVKEIFKNHFLKISFTWKTIFSFLKECESL